MVCPARGRRGEVDGCEASQRGYTQPPVTQKGLIRKIGLLEQKEQRKSRRDQTRDQKRDW